MEIEMVSLYDYLKKPAGPELGKQVAFAAANDKIKIDTNGPFFGAELVIKSKYQNYRIKEVGINTNLRKFGQGSIVSIKNIILTLKEIIMLFIKIHLKCKNSIKYLN